MPTSSWSFSDHHVCVVGSIGDTSTLSTIRVDDAITDCELIELRLDLYGTQINPAAWAHLKGRPLLMTARREDEGGAPGLDDARRFELLEMALPDAALVDLEVASIPKAEGLIEKLAHTGTPWVASFHNFDRMPDFEELREKVSVARESGAAAFKVAAMIRKPGDIVRLAEFQSADHGIPVATMGMGPAGVVSRLLCAQFGSVLNYGYLGKTPTAPGQWSTAEMKSAIHRLPRISP